MKKLLIIILVLLISASCREVEKETKAEIIIKEKTVENTTFTYPSYSENIDKKVVEEISNFIKNNKKIGKKIKIRYRFFQNDEYVSYMIFYNLNNRNIIKSYTYEIKTSERVVLSDTILNELNSKTQNTVTYQELELLNFLIINNRLIVYMMPILTGENALAITFDITDAYLRKQIKSNPTNKKRIAITFDDGPSLKTKELVDLLEELDVKATFFILGCNIKNHEEELMYIYSHDHEIGNHSYSHPNFKNITLEKGLEEISKTQEEIYKVINHYPRIFRFPYGIANNEVLEKIDFPIIFWNADSLDWKYDDCNEIYKKVLSEVKQDSIVLFHDYNKYKKEAIIKVINYLKNEDYSFVTISELFDFFSSDKIINGRVYY